MELAGKLEYETPQSLTGTEGLVVVVGFEVDESTSFEHESRPPDTLTCFRLTTSAGADVTTGDCTLAKYVAAW